MYKGTQTKLTVNLSEKKNEARRYWDEIFKVQEVKIYQSRILYPEKLSSKK